MSDRELIKAEIRRIMADEMSFFKQQYDGEDASCASSAVVYTRMQMLLQFIDSLPKEPVSYDLVKFADYTSINYRKQRESCGLKDPIALDEIEEANYAGIMAGAKWQEEKERNKV